MHPVIGLIQLLSIGFGAYFVLLVLYTMRGLARPPRQTYASAIARNLPGDPSELDIPISYQEHTIKAQGSQIVIWTLQGNNPDGPRVIMTHGWGSSKHAGLKRIYPFLDQSCQVILWDLPGHGDSSGCTHLGSDEHNALIQVLDSLEDQRPTILFGWSMGAGVSLAAAKQAEKEHQLIAIICESPYIDPKTPARNVIRLRGIPYRLNLSPAVSLLGLRFGVGSRWTGFARDRIAKDIGLPILILHGDVDPVCPIEDARRIEQAADNARLVTIEGAGHNNLWTDPVFETQMIAEIDGFIAEL